MCHSPLTTLLNGALVHNFETSEAPDHSPMIEIVTPSPAVTYATPVPVIEHVTPAPGVSYTAPAPVIGYATHAPSVTCTTPAPVTDCVTPSPVIEYISPPSAVALSIDTIGFVNPQFATTGRGGVCIRVCFARVHSCSSDLERDSGIGENHPSRARARDTWTCCRLYSACSSD